MSVILAGSLFCEAALSADSVRLSISVHVVVAGVEHVFVKEIGVFDCSNCKFFLASQGRRLTAGAAKPQIGTPYSEVHDVRGFATCGDIHVLAGLPTRQDRLASKCWEVEP